MASGTARHAPFLRLGGAACLVGLAIHFVVNGALKVMPPEGLGQPELASYLAEQASSWALVHGLRNLALPCLALFAAALFVRTCCLRTSAATGWGVLGLLGTAMLVINAFIANSIETAALLDDEVFAEEPASFYAVFRVSRVLFTAEIAAWAVQMLGFSVAGRCSRSLPGWLSALGGLSAAAGLLAGVFVVPIFEGRGPAVLLDVAALGGLAWFTATALHLLLRGASLPPDPRGEPAP